jgi:hypothetical protein
MHKYFRLMRVFQCAILASACTVAPVHGQTGNAATWTDPKSGLIWARSDGGSDVTQEQAALYCRELSVAGFKDWRLPVIAELEAIKEPAAKGEWHVKGGLKLTGWTWSSSRGDNPSVGLAFFFDSLLRASPSINAAYEGRALCVRGPTK